ncbi:CDP-glycerol glycerophosphotransferase family protein [Paramicrobacterium chengjingii]|uniref:CDP-glycerol glycerophosphotransferase family protein n=1 Tax=Paramicrobacterium chengjingii TaxID=2769067 RepID=UPI0014212F46|nr:CDP-glycerol glycerophosphotransferase family protein [Microbacterium chengjingii]
MGQVNKTGTALFSQEPGNTDDAGETHVAATADDEPKDRGSFSQRFMTAGGDSLTAGLFGVLSVMFAGANAHSPSPSLAIALFAAGTISLVVILWAAIASPAVVKNGTYPTGALVVPRVLLLAAFGIFALANNRVAVVDWVVVSLMLALLVAELSYRRIVQGAIPYGVNIPGLTIRNRAFIRNKVPFWASTGSVAIICISLAAFDHVAFAGSILVAGTALTLGIGAIDGVLRVRSRRYADRKIFDLLSKYKPSFVVHWDADAGTGYQLGMWLPYLERIGANFFVIVRNRNSFEEVAKLTDSPVLLRQALEDMDSVVVPSLTTAFYVNNAVRNAHFARYTQLKHVQINHGDSDKAPSYNPVLRLFDHNFVAGQAAIDRFTEHGVKTRDGFFEIVGRPQVDGIEVGCSVQENGPARSMRVLYAPTWAGFHADSAYSSLAIGPEIVRALVARGCEVIYRPHPYTTKNQQHSLLSRQIKQFLERDMRETGRKHVLGEHAEIELSVVECFNLSDAMVADISSVVPDFLYSEKPFALCSMSSGVAQLERELPIAAAGYSIESDARNLESVLDDLLGSDPNRASRIDLKSYYLGSFPDGRYVEGFLEAARRVIYESTK